MFNPIALYVVGIMSGAVSVAVLGSLPRAGVPGLSRWIAANAMIVAGFLVLALQSEAPGPMAVLTSSVLFAGAALAVLQGIRLFFGLRASHAYEIWAYAALAAGLGYWTYLAPDVNARIVLMSTFIAYVRLVVGWTAYTMRPPHRPVYSYRFVVIIALLGALVHIARALATGLGWEHHTQFLDSTPANIAFLAIGIVTLPCLSIGAIMLAYDRMAESMERLATIDGLTGALVRRAFLAQAELELERAKRTNSRLAVAILDIDDFKAINDGHGHAAGDLALSYFCSIVSLKIRRGDIFGRLGGEEFAVLFPATSRADAAALVDRLRMQVASSRLALPHGEVTCMFSAGVDEYHANETLANLMARVDAALYSAKAMGRNRVVSAVSIGD